MLGNQKYIKPYIGAKYEHGLYGVKIMVVGASHYCYGEPNSPICKKCTSDLGWRDIDDCPRGKICNFTIDEVDSYLNGEINTAYSLFFQLLAGESNYTRQDIWEHIIFFNFIQAILPSPKTPKETDNSCLYEKSKVNFENIVIEHKPDLIIIWGDPIGNYILGKYAKKGNPLQEVSISKHTCWIRKIYHPSSFDFKNESWNTINDAINYAKNMTKNECKSI